MRQKRWIWQTAVCAAVLIAVQGGMGAVTAEKYKNLGEFIEKVSEAIEKNYTLAELLELGEETAEAAVSMPFKISSAVVSATEQAMYGMPLDDEVSGEEPIQPVYASAGGRVLRSGLQNGLGLYVMVEHQNKISTYGHLSSVRVLEGDRIQKGEILGSYDRTSAQDFYYSLEEKS